jgi:ferredoxin
VSSPFEVLGVDPDADEATVRRAYRNRVKDAHPDHGGSQREFRAVREAYEAILSGEATPPEETTRGEGVDGAGPGDEHESDGGESDRADATTATRTNGHAAGATEGTGSGDGNGAGGVDADAGADEDDEDTDGIRVEYLDYEALDDHGWNLGTEDLFAKAAAADLDDETYGVLTVERTETLLEAAERAGYDWPFACRGGACTNCAIAVFDGDVTTPRGHILPDEVRADGIRLSCLGRPTVDGTQVVFNVKHLPFLDELVLPANQ